MYARGRSGVMRSWRFQPIGALGGDPRAAPSISAVIVAERDQADHEVERRRDPAAAEVVLAAVRARDQRGTSTSGKPSEKMKKRRLRNVRSSSKRV